MSTDEIESLKRPLRRASRWVAGSVAVLGLAFLLAWFRGAGERLAFAATQVPTAPATAFLAIILALAIITSASSHPRVSTRTAPALMYLALFLALAFGSAYIAGVDFPLERWLSGPPRVRDGVVIGRISIITCGLFAILATALLAGQSRYVEWEGRLATLAMALAFLVLQGYVLGAPLLYGSSTIPVAAPTALLVWLLALATLLRSSPTSWPLRVVLPTRRIGVLPTTTNFLWLAILFGGVVISSGIFWYVAQRERAESAAVTTLRTVGNLKAAELAQWYEGLRSTAATLVDAPLDADWLRAAIATADSPARRGLQSWLDGLRLEHGYEAVVLIAADERVLMRSEAADARPLPLLLPQLRRLRGDSLHASQVYRVGDTVRKTFWVPVHLEPGRRGTAGAWLAFVIPIDRSLYPRLNDNPAGFATSDYSLWQIEPDSARLILSPRDTNIAALSLALDRETQQRMFAQLASPRGYEGPGFKGAPIRAVVSEVRGPGWQLVVKVDERELRAPAFTAALRATIFSLAFLLGAAAIIYALWYRQDLARTRMELSLIEDRERGLRAIEASEQRYARAMRGTTDGLWDMNMVTGEAYVSPRWREIAGIPNESAIRSEEEFLAFIHPEDIPKQQQAMRDHLERGLPYDLELRVHPRLGLGTRWIRTRAEVERDAEGRPVWMSGAITDVTRQHLAEDALRRTDRILRVRSAVNQALVRADDKASLLQLICEVGVREGGYKMVWIGRKENDEARTVKPMAVAGDERGYLAENPISWGEGPTGLGPTGRCIRTGEPQVAQDLLAEHDYAPWREAARERGYQSSASIPLIVNGEIWGGLMLYAGEPYAFDAEELEMLSALGRDIAFGIGALRNFLSMRAQREQLTLFRQAIDRSADAIFVADLATGKFVDFNVACLAQLGYTAEEMLTIGPADIVPDLGARGGLTAVANSIREAGGIVRPSLHRRKDGDYVPVEVALSVVDIGPRSVVLGIARDISDRLKADADREELQQMLNRSLKMESVGRLAGGVAHDFNNLLTVINATAELALSEVEPDSALYRDLMEIRASGDRAAALTRQLLAFSRQQVLKREVLSLNDVVSGFLKMVSRVIGEDIHLELRLGGDVADIEADKNQLEQVLMNLCVNARDAMPRGGTLTISTGSAIVDEAHAARREGMTPGRYVTLSVTDTGVGMDKATQAKIFEPFFTTKETGRGTGLGLSTVYGIVKQSGGSVWVYSELGKGSTFRVYLPVTDASREDSASVQLKTAAVGRETILVVEDEESIRMVARRVLERAGYTVLEADSGPAALGLIDVAAPALDLVMTDLVMPGMTGLELATELRRRRPQLKVLFTSGYSADVVSDRFPHTDDWNFISKPYGMQELVAEIRRVLDS